MAYEVRISDWSSDVCSSDHDVVGDVGDPQVGGDLLGAHEPRRGDDAVDVGGGESGVGDRGHRGVEDEVADVQRGAAHVVGLPQAVEGGRTDRKRVVMGERGYVVGDGGGPRTRKTKTN